MKGKFLIVGESNDDSNLSIDWWVPPHGKYDDWKFDEGRDCAYEWMKFLSKKQKTKRIYWFDPYSIKHDVEDWKQGNPNHRYVSRDMVVAAAILTGLPVKIDSDDHHHNKIGLYMTRLQYQKLAFESGVSRYGWRFF